MSEAEELKAFKKRLDAKYGKLAKKRLASISKVFSLEQQLVDMSDKDFNNWLSSLINLDSQKEPDQKDKLVNLVNMIKSGKFGHGSLTGKDGETTGHWVNQEQVVEKLEGIIHEC